jgi:hypothetical protein
MQAGDKVLMNFPAANRDPEAFEDPDTVVLDRPSTGTSPSARGSTAVPVPTWPAWSCGWPSRSGWPHPEFRLAEGTEVTWAGGQVRGPRRLPVVFP